MARRASLRGRTDTATRTPGGASRRLAAALADAGRAFYARGWALGTSGNFSAVLRREPFRLLISASGLDKAVLDARQFVEMSADGRVLRGAGKPSAEAVLHVTVARARGAGAVLHTHSIWSTLLSDLHGSEGGLTISGYEMLKGLAGVTTHEHREWLPIVENSQDMAALAATVRAALLRHPNAHGFLLRGHGLYTWGDDLPQARRHVEVLEFLMEVVGRTRSEPPGPGKK
jgi:methylthioribulose-1-phosphate dehydratase